MNRWLIRMAMWARRPPSESRVKLVLGVIAIGIAIVLIEKFIGWPDWATADPRGMRR